MIRYKQLVTLKVVDKDTNQHIGRIDDVIYSDDYKRVDYLIIKNDNLIRNKAVIDYKDILFINNSKVMYLGDSKNLENKLERNTNNDREGKKFIDKQIKSKDNECIGYVKDVVINKENGVVDGFIITEGLFEDLIKGRNYLPLLDYIEINDNYIYIPNDVFV